MIKIHNYRCLAGSLSEGRGTGPIELEGNERFLLDAAVYCYRDAGANMLVKLLVNELTENC